MEVVEAAVFIPLAIIAATQAIKYVLPHVNGAVTIAVAVLLGVVLALVDNEIGVTDVTVAQGVMRGLESVGIVTVATKITGSSNEQ